VKKVAFYTLGCKLNFSESSAIARQFQKENYAVVDFGEAADVYVINTCSVTDHADRKTKHVVKNALSRNSLANVVVIGCYAQLKPQEIVKIPGVNLVLGAAEKFNIVSHVQNLEYGCEPAIYNSHIKEIQVFNPAYSAGDRTRSFLKVQDGCNYFCAFCTIPLARGRSRSSTIADVVKSGTEIAGKGIKEIVLTGVNIGDFQNDQEEDFLKLIQALDDIDGIERFRISSIEPNLLTPEIISFVAGSKKFVPHFHIPLQSGSDKILELMRRRYKKELYQERVEMIKNIIPQCCIGVDVIVGFPGETDEDFRETYDFIHSLPVSYLHVFTYSERPDTTALRLNGSVPNATRSERNNMLTNLSEKKRRLFYEDNLGKEFPVLWEQQKHGEWMQGYTSNYIKVKTDYDPAKVNIIQRVVLNSIDNGGVVVANIPDLVNC
jgi:threonylcarbamoyladenosine tRNA methylthiotransferase MtaB